MNDGCRARIRASLPVLLYTLALTAAGLAQTGASTAVAMSQRDSRAGTLVPGEGPLFLEFTTDPGEFGGDIFHVRVAGAGVAISLLAPSGTEIDSANAEAQGYSFTAFEGVPNHPQVTGPLAMPGFHTMIVLPPGAAPGSYRIKAASDSTGEETAVLAVYTSSSGVRAALTTGQSTYRAGDPVVFTALFFDAAEPLGGLTASVRIRPRDDPSAAAVDLRLEDSSEVDEQAGDGQYFGVWRPERAGHYVAALKASGTSLSGVPFSRIASTGFRILPPLARIESIRDMAVDDDGDGVADRVVFEVSLDVKKDGNYQVLFNLRSSGEAKVAGRRRAALEVGKARAEISFPLRELGPLAADGPYTLTDVFLLYLDAPDAAVADHRADAGKTAPYPLADLLASKGSPITASSTTLAFGDVQTGSSRELALTLRNRSQYAFTERMLRLGEGPFTVVAPAVPFTAPAGGETALRVRFAPASAGQRTAALSIAGVSIALSGNGVAPRFTVTPASLDFGSVTVGQSKDLSVVVTNVSGTQRTVAGLTVTNGSFRVLSGAAPFTLAASQRQTISVRFAPEAGGAQVGVLRTDSVDIPLAGEGLVPGEPPKPEPPGPPPPDPGPGPGPQPPDPAPGEFRITSLEPASAVAGDFGFTLTVNGSGFNQGAIVRWNTVNRQTTFVSATQLTAAISRADIASAGAAAVTVANGGTGAAISNALSFSIAPAPAPTTSVLLQQFDRVDCPTVRVFASVLSPDGSPVERAPAARFACSENGQPVNCRTTVAGDSSIPASIVIILPSNGLGANLDAVRAAANGLVNTMSEGDRAALIHLQTQASLLQGFTGDRNGLLARIGQYRQAGEGHALLDAIDLATGLFATERGRRQAIFLITHRDSQGGAVTNAGTVLSNVRTRGIPIYSLAFGPALGSGTLGALLKAVTADSHGVLLTEESVTNLAAPAARLSRIFRAQYALTYNVAANEASAFRLIYTDSPGTVAAERSRPACGQ